MGKDSWSVFLKVVSFMKSFFFLLLRRSRSKWVNFFFSTCGERKWDEKEYGKKSAGVRAFLHFDCLR